MDYSVQASGTGTPPLPAPELLSGTIDVQETGSGTNTLWVYVTEQGLTAPTGVAAFVSGFTSNVQSASTVLEETEISTTNALFAGTVLDTAPFGASGGLQTAQSTDNSPSLSAPYSETEVYKITTTATGQSADLTISLNTVPVPEPASLAIFGTALVGIGLARRRRKSV